MSHKTFWHALLLVGSLWLVLVLWLAASVAWCGGQQPAPAHVPQSSPRANTSGSPVNCHQSEPPTSSPWLAVARADAQREGIDVLTFTWQINQESGYQPNVTSSAGAEGIAQFMPDTARGLGIDPWNPRQALAGAAKLDAAHLAQYASKVQALAAHYGGSAARYAYGLALAAYNAGPGATTEAWNRAYGADPPFTMCSPEWPGHSEGGICLFLSGVPLLVSSFCAGRAADDLFRPRETHYLDCWGWTKAQQTGPICTARAFRFTLDAHYVTIWAEG